MPAQPYMSETPRSPSARSSPALAAGAMTQQEASASCSASGSGSGSASASASAPAPSSARWFCCSCLCIPRRPPQRRQEYEPPPQPSPSSMVHMFYYENRGKCCKKLLRYNGYPNKVLLFPEEGWARSASSSYWTLTPAWWSRSRCKVVEVAGTRRYTTQAKMVDTGSGSLYIVGSFKRVTPDPDFKLYLTSNVSASDFNMGYSMTGTLERGCRHNNSFQTTHFAVIRRRDYDKQ